MVWDLTYMSHCHWWEILARKKKYLWPYTFFTLTKLLQDRWWWPILERLRLMVQTEHSSISSLYLSTLDGSNWEELHFFSLSVHNTLERNRELIKANIQETWVLRLSRKTRHKEENTRQPTSWMLYLEMTFHGGQLPSWLKPGARGSTL